MCIWQHTRYLSACETAAGNERTAFGLAGVAIRAGAKKMIEKKIV
ncbi:hypothetical protein [Desulfonema limicola]|nr:hypothetical protein [Desulfonema limicola]